MSFPEWLQESLRCPKCKNKLELAPAISAEIVCSQCEQTYSQVDGIPVLIVK